MKKLIAFHGCDHKVGTTMISQSVAELIAEKRKDLRILWIVCSRGGGDEYAPIVKESVEGLKDYLDNGLLRSEEVIQSCQKTENLFLIGGVHSLLQERYYFPKTAIYLLQSLENSFDLMIADCGNDIDNGLSVGALTCGGVNVLVTKQSEISLRRMHLLQAIYGQLHISFSHLIINCFSEEKLLFPEEILKRLQLQDVAWHLIGQTEDGQRAELENRTLISYGNRRFQKEVNQLTDWILEEVHLGGQEKRRKLPWKNFI